MSCAGCPTLVSYGRAERQAEQIGEVSQRHRAATMRTLRLAFLSSAALELLATISVAIVAVSVGLRLTNGSVGLETGMLAILLSPEAYWPIRRVGAEFHDAADGAEAIAAILTELDAPTTGPAGTGDRPARDQPRSASSRGGVHYAYPRSRHPSSPTRPRRRTRAHRPHRPLRCRQVHPPRDPRRPA